MVDGDRFIGKVEVRHRLTAALRLRGGHIGYAIRPTMRRRGYGSLALSMVLPRCRDLGLDRVLVSCDESNQASRRIIETNGGVLEGVVHLPGRAVATMRYWIDVAANVGSAHRVSARARYQLRVIHPDAVEHIAEEVMDFLASLLFRSSSSSSVFVKVTLQVVDLRDGATVVSMHETPDTAYALAQSIGADLDRLDADAFATEWGIP